MKLCPSCGKPNHDSAESCIFCTSPMVEKKQPENDIDNQLIAGLDPLDQFLVTKAQSNELDVKELSSFSGDYDHIEDELEDAQRKADLHRKLQILKQSKVQSDAPPTPTAPKDTASKVDAIEALLFGNPEAVAANTPQAPSPSPQSTAPQPSTENVVEKKADRIEKLEKYQRFIDDKPTSHAPTVGDNQAQQIISYLESKISGQALEIDDLKKQKNELVKEVFSEALEDEHQDYEGKIKELAKKLSNAEAIAKDLKDRRVATDAKLFQMRDELDRLHGGGSDQFEEKLRKEISADFSSIIDEQTNEHKATLQSRDAEWQEVFRKKQADYEATLAAEQEKTETLEQQLQDSLAAMSGAAGGVSNTEMDAMRQQVAKKAIEASALREKLETSASRIQGLSSYYKTILGQMSDGIVVIDSKEKLFYINSAACNIMGFRPSETETRTLGEIPELSLLVEYRQGVLGGENYDNVEIAFRVQGVTANAVLSANKLHFINQDLCVLRLHKSEHVGSQLSLLGDLPAPSLERIQESLFSLRILVELCKSKYQQPETVLELVSQIFTEINQLLEFVNIKSS